MFIRIKLSRHLFPIFYIFGGIGFEPRALGSSLLGKSSTTWAMHPALLYLFSKLLIFYSFLHDIK
jgi:hypothetical protein